MQKAASMPGPEEKGRGQCLQTKKLWEGLQNSDQDLRAGTPPGPGLMALRAGVLRLLLGVGRGLETETTC